MTWQTPDGVTVVCLTSSRPAQAMTMKTTRKTEEERQRQPRKVVHMPQAICGVLNIGWAHSTVGRAT